MNTRTSLPLKISYGLVLLSMVLPFGLAKSGWVGLATGGGALGIVPFVGPLVFLVLGIYRIYLVARIPGVLDSPSAKGFVSAMRAISAFLLYVGAVISVLSWAARPLMRAFMTTRTESGAEYFAVGLYLAMAGGIGVLGLFLFEFSRLLAFERSAEQTSA
jgi:hypothetical protein